MSQLVRSFLRYKRQTNTVLKVGKKTWHQAVTATWLIPHSQCRQRWNWTEAPQHKQRERRDDDVRPSVCLSVGIIHA